ncbi:DUF4394 domain-containing protein, partial [archaeon]
MVSIFILITCLVNCSSAHTTYLPSEVEECSYGLAHESLVSSQNVLTNVLMDTGTYGYGYVTNDWGTISEGTCYFDLGDPGTITEFGFTASDFIATADFVGDTWYGIVYGGTLVSIDTTTGAISTIGNTVDATGMTYDTTTDTMFAVEPLSGGLYSIDLDTGTETLIGHTITYIIALECSNDGTLYGIEIINDTFGTVDKQNGTWTAIGSIGMDLNFAQDASFDHVNDVLYHAAYSNSGKLVTIDLDTGTATEVGAFPYGLEMTGFAIPYESNADPVAEFSYAPQMPKTGQTISFDPSASYDPDGTIVTYEW